MSLPSGPNPWSHVLTLAKSGDTVYAGGGFGWSGGGSRSTLAALDTTVNTDNATAWDPDSSALVYSIYASGPTVYVGGQLVLIGGEYCYGIAIFTSAPEITGITPAIGYRGRVVNVTDLAGTSFRAGATVRLARAGQPYIPAAGVSVVSSTRIACTFDLTGAQAGAWDVVVKNTDGWSGVLAGGFTINQAVSTWYLAEGCTGGDFETWVLVQNPNPDPVTVDLTFMTSGGPMDGPQDFSIAGNSRQSFNVNSSSRTGPPRSRRLSWRPSPASR